MDAEKDAQEVLVGDPLWVEGQLHDLGVAGAAGADLFVAGVFGVAAHVAGDDALDAGQELIDGLEAPEAAAR